MAALVKAVDKVKRKKPRRLGVRSIEIDRAENGFTTRTRYETESGPDYEYDPGDTHVHPNKQAMTNFINGLFKDGDPKDRRMKAMKSMMDAEPMPMK